MTRLGITGHQDLAPEVRLYVVEKLKHLFSHYNSLCGISCLAAGADQLFARLVIENGGVLEVIMPTIDYRTTFTNTQDLLAYDELLNKAELRVTMPFSHPSEDAFFEAGKEVVRRCDRLIAVWDGHESRGKGGTGDVVEYARGSNVDITVMWPHGLERK